MHLHILLYITLEEKMQPVSYRINFMNIEKTIYNNASLSLDILTQLTGILYMVST